MKKENALKKNHFILCNEFKLIVIYLSFCLIITSPSLLKAQINKSVPEIVLAGFEKKITGTTVSHASGQTDINDALIVRNASTENNISWKTTKIPASYNNKFVYFTWVAGFATGKNRQESSFDFYANQNKIFDIKIKTNTGNENWTLKNAEGYELSFLKQFVDYNGDTFGFCYLKVPVNTQNKGKELTLSIKSENGKRYDDWLMTFTHQLKEKVNIVPRLLLRKQNDQLQQLISINVTQLAQKNEQATFWIDEKKKETVTLKPGNNNFELWIPAVTDESVAVVNFFTPNTFKVKESIKLQPVKRRELYLVNHSHNDIGYSDLQEMVAKKQNEIILKAIQIIDKTADYPVNAKFKWNIEALWAVENFMNVATKVEKDKLIKYVKEGKIGLPAGYANLLTGMCRPEELIHLTDYSARLNRKYNINFKSLMLSDVPGMSWNMVSALAQRGVRYVSSGPNFIPHEGFPDVGARVGQTHKSWGDKPFYWTSASGLDSVLFWQAGTGYSWFQDWNMGRLRFENKPMNLLMDYLQQLQNDNYKYEMVQLRYSIINDNSDPDDGISDFVKTWNEKYESPKFIITNIDDMMETFEKRYANKIPKVTGDYTPYWEDGVMSSANEEVITKRSVERLYQSEVLNTLMYPGNYNEEKYYQAWKNTILWHEHTWGAWNSISNPTDPFVIKQWEYKQNYAFRADTLSRELLNLSIKTIDNVKKGFNVINTSSWDRTDLVILSATESSLGDVVVDENGQSQPSQRLSDGRLAFLAQNVPALKSKQFYNKRGKSTYKSALKIGENYSVENANLKLIIDEKTGAIKSLVNKKSQTELVDRSKYAGLNQYLYIPGLDPSKVETVKNVTIKIKEQGPLIVTYEITAQANGIKKLVQEISLINELDKIDLTNIVDKIAVTKKESVHFAFPVKLEGGKMNLDLGTGILKPGINQLKGANKEYLTMQRWVDVSNKNQGLTFITREVPLIEEGEMVNEKPIVISNNFGGENGEKKWRDYTTFSNTFFSYAMNNYWYTNYRASQEGKVTFHYSIYLHENFDASWATRKGKADAQPLLVNNIDNKVEVPFILNDKHIHLTTAKPALNGKGYILRFINSSTLPQQLNLKATAGKTINIYLSNANEEKLKPFDLRNIWQPFELKTLIVETQ